MTTIGYQGVEGSFSYLACNALYPNTPYKDYKTFYDVVNATVNNEVDCCVVPIENSYAGRVFEIHNILPKVGLTIVAEKILPIKHHLAVIDSSVKLSHIKTIGSHEQALMQCRDNLRNSLPNASLKSELNTAIAAQNLSLSQSTTSACLCSELAIQKFNLHLLKPNMQDSSSNYTTFISLAPSSTVNIPSEIKNLFLNNPSTIETTFQTAPTKGTVNLTTDSNPNLTTAFQNNSIRGNSTPDINNSPSQNFSSQGSFLQSLIFWLNNEPGAICNSLKGFAEEGISLVKLESYIDLNSTSAKFFLSFTENPNMESNIKALDTLFAHSKQVKFLGRYKADAIRNLN